MRLHFVLSLLFCQPAIASSLEDPLEQKIFARVLNDPCLYRPVFYKERPYYDVDSPLSLPAVSVPDLCEDVHVKREAAHPPYFPQYVHLASTKKRSAKRRAPEDTTRPASHTPLKHPRRASHLTKANTPEDLASVMALDQAGVLTFAQFVPCAPYTKGTFYQDVCDVSEGLLTGKQVQAHDALAALAGFYAAYANHSGSLRWRACYGVGRTLMIMGHLASAREFLERVVAAKGAPDLYKEEARKRLTRLNEKEDPSAAVK
ncbi:MAG: hypothetical protein C0514_01775 [Candidatus Puniceispirillum sp.]|nr:hypothetical protein [Candidatus Puniceispirillum sp.]